MRVVATRIRLGVTHWDAVGVLLPDALGLSLALLEGVLVLELGAHSGGVVLVVVDGVAGGNQ
jgi:hypothetical protein